MDYTRLGSAGLKVSRISLGAMGFGSKSWRSWVLEPDEARPIVKAALDLGINLIDTCNYYSLGQSELFLGELLKSYVDRSDVLIATKLGYQMGRSKNAVGYSRKNIIEAAEASLRRLGVDHIDLYQTHIWDPATNIEEMVAAFDILVRAGKVLYVGATDIPGWQFVKAVYLAKSAGLHSFNSHQYHYNLLWREAEREVMPFCRDEGIGLLPYSPLARGVLSGDRDTERARTDNLAQEWFRRPCDRKIIEVVDKLARIRGCTSSQLAMAWVLHQPGVSSTIFGASSVRHVEEAVAAIEIKLEQSELQELVQLYEPRPSGAH